MRNRLLTLALATIAACIGDKPSGTEPSAAPKPPAPEPPHLPSIELHTPHDTVFINETVRFTAVVRDELGRIVENPEVVWRFTDLPRWNSVQITTGEIVTRTPKPLDSYSITMEASYLGAVARRTLLVAPAIGSVAFKPTSWIRTVGMTDSLPVEVRSPLTDVIGGYATHWTSSDTSVATVTDGIVSTRRPGAATISATVGLVRASMPLIVVPPYRVTEIRGIGGSPSIVDMNDRGDVLGYVTAGTEGTTPQFFYKDGLARSVDECRYAVDLNNRSQLLCDTGSGVALWDAGVIRPLDIPRVAGARYSFRFNDSGAVAFTSTIGPDGVTCTASALCLGVWHPGNAVVWRHTPPYMWNMLKFFNDESVVVGGEGGGYFAAPGSEAWDGFYSPTVVTNIVSWTALSGATNGGSTVYTFHLNSLFSFGYFRSPGGPSTKLVDGSAVDINERGYIIGHSDALSSGYLANGPNGVFGRLGDLTLDRDWEIRDPIKINNQGVILATARNRTDGHLAVVLLSPGGQ